MEFKLRELKASDLGQVCKILAGIGIKEFKNCFTGVDITQKEVEKIGMSVALDMVGIIMEHIPSVQKDIDKFLASVTGMKVEEISNLPLADYGELIFTVVTKDEFKDFFNRATKLFNP